MKRILTLVLLMAIVCSLSVFAPTAAALSEEEEALYTKYADLIGLLEAENYDAALESVLAMMPATEYEEVVLTPENLLEYFDITTGEPQIDRDSSGKIKSIWPGGLLLVMKEDVSSRLNWEASSLVVGIKAKKDMYRAKIDWETGEITLSDKKDSDVKKAVKKLDWFESKVDEQIDGVYYQYYITSDPFWYKHPVYKGWSSGYAEPDLNTKYYQVVYTDIELVNVEGSLFLSK